jgi:hypothetical protein
MPFVLSIVVAMLFVTAMLSLIAGLLYFLREVTRATHSMQMGMEVIVDDIQKE